MNTFKITLREDWFKKNDIININDQKVVVISTPKIKYNTWYFKLLNFLTFKKYFNNYYFYKVKPMINTKSYEKKSKF